MKYSDQIAEWLVQLGYTHCFYLAGGNIMHLLESCSHRFVCIPVVHEVAAGIAAEYFNETSSAGKAFALVTAGPGLTNIVTALAGAYLESHELLVIGGQVKLADLAHGAVRQRGIQEIDGVSIAKPVTLRSTRILQTISGDEFRSIVQSGSTSRKGPIFIEMPLDLQGKTVDACPLHLASSTPQALPSINQAVLERLAARLRAAQRPILLIGGGVERATIAPLLPRLAQIGIPLMTTWNGIDRVPSEHPLYFGRPNTWGQRSSNILLQQADLVIALGTRLGLQQTGFNWQEFIPEGEVVQVDCDASELSKGHPQVALPVHGDANQVLAFLASAEGGDFSDWVSFCTMVRTEIPLNESSNQTGEGFISPYTFIQQLSQLCTATDNVIPCSSGGAYTVFMQAFDQKLGQKIVNTKGLASMGYGLSGAIGAAIANPGRRNVLVEGDGGFLQNLQELGTVAINRLNLKIFIFDNHGYASIRMTQKNYFAGHYVGCDDETGLYTPVWQDLFRAYNIPLMRINIGFQEQEEFLKAFDHTGPAAFIVTIDPEQTYFPKISSRVNENGAMESNPLHLMSPDLPPEVAAKVFRYLRTF